MGNQHRDKRENNYGFQEENSSNKMSREEIGRKGGSAPHECRGFECQEEHGAKPGSMTPEEAGALGGSAPHKCRGRGCNVDEAEQEEDQNQEEGWFTLDDDDSWFW